MLDFWNFKDAFIVAQTNWVWLLLALVIGLMVGWATCRYTGDNELANNKSGGN